MVSNGKGYLIVSVIFTAYQFINNILAIVSILYYPQGQNLFLSQGYSVTISYYSGLGISIYLVIAVLSGLGIALGIFGFASKKPSLIIMLVIAGIFEFIFNIGLLIINFGNNILSILIPLLVIIFAFLAFSKMKASMKTL